VDQEVTVELKNDIRIKGTLKSVDQFLNIKLDDIQVLEELKYPHLVRRIQGVRQDGRGTEAYDRAVIGEECVYTR
jgi:small nuclear ribonucleoprotein (snRNP)-like protein